MLDAPENVLGLQQGLAVIGRLVVVQYRRGQQGLQMRQTISASAHGHLLEHPHGHRMGGGQEPLGVTVQEVERIGPMGSESPVQGLLDLMGARAVGQPDSV